MGTVAGWRYPGSRYSSAFSVQAVPVVLTDERVGPRGQGDAYCPGRALTRERTVMAGPFAGWR